MNANDCPASAATSFPSGVTPPGALGGKEVQAYLAPQAIKSINIQLFFLLATSNDEGSSDCSYRGRERLPDGSYEPLVKILDPSTLVFPDYKGNNLFNSIGNLIVNPAIALLFVDFERDASFSIQGQATIVEDSDRWIAIWPSAQRYIIVAITQVRSSVPAHLPKLVLAPT